MASGKSSWLQINILYKIPYLYKKCPNYNYHYFWHRLCFCRVNEHCGDKWHGGVYDFKTGKEYIIYKDMSKCEHGVNMDKSCKKCDEWLFNHKVKNNPMNSPNIR